MVGGRAIRVGDGTPGTQPILLWPGICTETPGVCVCGGGPATSGGLSRCGREASWGLGGCHRSPGPCLTCSFLWGAWEPLESHGRPQHPAGLSLGCGTPGQGAGEAGQCQPGTQGDPGPASMLGGEMSQRAAALLEPEPAFQTPRGGVSWGAPLCSAVPLPKSPSPPQTTHQRFCTRPGSQLPQQCRLHRVTLGDMCQSVWVLLCQSVRKCPDADWSVAPAKLEGKGGWRGLERRGGGSAGAHTAKGPHTLDRLSGPSRLPDDRRWLR